MCNASVNVPARELMPSIEFWLLTHPATEPTRILWNLWNSGYGIGLGQQQPPPVADKSEWPSVGPPNTGPLW